MENPGRLVELKDGRKGIAYNEGQIHPIKTIIKILDDEFNPVISKTTGKQVVVFKEKKEFRIVGFVD